MADTDITAWGNFFVAELGASAALAGLLFVAVSINLARILSFAHLPTRAAEALGAFFSVLVVATVALVPHLSPEVLGGAIAATGAFVWLANTISLVRTWSEFAKYGPKQRALFNQLPPLPFVVAGALIATGHPSGVYWIVPATLLSFAAGVFGAWVLLVEIQR